MTPYRPSTLLAALLITGGLSVGTASASIILVTLDTSPLIGAATGPYYLEFQLVDGDGFDNNLVLLDSFNFFGGGAVGLPTIGGGASGDLSMEVVLDDSVFFTEFYQQFAPGPLLSFNVTFSTNFGGGTPDQFSFAILNGSLFEIADGPGGEFLSIDLLTPVVINTFAATGSFGDPVLDSPTIAAVPEPTSLLLIGIGVMALCLARKRATLNLTLGAYPSRLKP